MTKKYRNSFKTMRPDIAKHVGREIFNATLTDCDANDVNTRLAQADVTNPNGSPVIFSDEHLSQMKAGIRKVFTLIQEKAPHRMQEAYEMVTSMNTGGFYGPWYVKYCIPFALETGGPLWMPYATAKKVANMMKSSPGKEFTYASGAYSYGEFGKFQQLKKSSAPGEAIAEVTDQILVVCL